MSIADKLVTIAENDQRVYKAGQLNVLANAESLNGSLSGEAVSANDVIGIEHNIPCQLTSETITDFSSVNVSRYGKNLFEFKQGAIGKGTIIENLENGDIVQGNYVENDNPNAWSNGWYTFTNKATVTLKAGDVVTLSCDYTVLELNENRTMKDFSSSVGVKKVGLYLQSSGSNHYLKPTNQPKILGETVRMSVTATITVDGEYYPTMTVNSNKVRIENIQIEIGSTATPYEPYIAPQTVTANADGTVEGITSIAPNMTLLTDTDGVVINANYYKDPDIVISNLAQSVALSGGEG